MLTVMIFAFARNLKMLLKPVEKTDFLDLTLVGDLCNLGNPLETTGRISSMCYDDSSWPILLRCG